MSSLKVALLGLILPIAAHASVQKTTEQLATAQLQRALGVYREVVGKDPVTWYELKREAKTRNYVLELSRQSPDYMGNYRFISTAKPVKIQDWPGVRGQREIVVMGISARHRSNDAPPAESERLLITRDDMGRFFVGQHTEAGLARVFQQAGYDIADYTGSHGNWQPEPADQVESHRRDNEDQTDRDAVRDPKDRGNTEASQHGSDNDAGSASGFSAWLLLLIAGPLLIVWMFWMRWRRQRSNHSGK